MKQISTKCVNCKKVFTYELQRSKRKYCSKKCRSYYNNRMDREGVARRLYRLPVDRVTPSEEYAMSIGKKKHRVIPSAHIQSLHPAKLAQTVNHILSGKATMGALR